MTIDVNKLWDFSDPELSEQRFRSALVGAAADAELVLQTQIARTFSLRKEFDKAQTILRELDQGGDGWSAEARVRYDMELGRTYVSGSHSRDAVSGEDLARARSLYLGAFEAAKAAGLDGLAVDSIHMMAFVDTDPEDQLSWARLALEFVASSDQSEAKQWEASLHNNAGYALHCLGRYEEALSEFRQALTLRESGSNAWATHVAHWMVAWTLRALERTDEALAIQLRLERNREAEGEPDVSVFEELESLYGLLGDEEKAKLYAEKAKAAGGES